MTADAKVVDWPEIPIADISAPGPNAMATGPFGSAISSRFFQLTGVPVIRGGNLSADSAIRLRDDDLVYLNPEKAAEFSRSTVRNGDIVFTCWGTINQIGLIDERAAHPEYVISNKQMKLTPDPRRASSKFLYYLFSSPEFQREILDGSIGSSIPGFNLTRLRSMQVHLPSLPEQQVIANALGDADDLIVTTTKYIMKKTAMRDGMAQSLLAGQVRLPGFTDSWGSGRSLQDICGRRSGYWGSDAATAAANVKVDVIRAGDIQPDGDLVGWASRYFSAEEWQKAACQTDDVVVTTSGNGLGKTCYIQHPRRLAASNFVRILRPNPGVSGEFLAYLMRSKPVRRLLETHTATSAYPNLLPSFYVEPWVSVPPLDEQLAIAQVLRSADAEIRALRQQLNKYRGVYKGMMQALLTGRIRLPLPETAS